MSKYFVLLYVAATSLALIALKLGTKSGIPIHYVNNKLQFNINFYTVAGIALYGLSFLTYVYLISKYDLGYIIPLTTALVYVIIFTASFFIFDEVFTMIKIAGIVFIVIGLMLLNVKS